MPKQKVYYNLPTYEYTGEWCPECSSELHYRELIGGGTHYYCMMCDYEKWED